MKHIALEKIGNDYFVNVSDLNNNSPFDKMESKMWIDEHVQYLDTDITVFGNVRYKFNKARLEKFLKYCDDQNVHVYDLNGMPLKINADIDLKGKTVVFTGKIEGMTRDQARTFVGKMGGFTQDTVSRYIDYVITGERTGQKMSDAKRYGIPLIEAEDFKKMCHALDA
jgi:NAD-dependent DNA ligase